MERPNTAEFSVLSASQPNSILCSISGGEGGRRGGGLVGGDAKEGEGEPTANAQPLQNLLPHFSVKDKFSCKTKVIYFENFLA